MLDFLPLSPEAKLIINNVCPWINCLIFEVSKEYILHVVSKKGLQDIILVQVWKICLLAIVSFYSSALPEPGGSRQKSY